MASASRTLMLKLLADFDNLQKQIFEPFFTNKEKGTGLGLAICLKIIQLHQGDLSLTSGHGLLGGCEFMIELPIKQPQDQQKLNEQAGQYAVLEAYKNIQMSILQTYLQILYADEAVKINKSTVEVSEFQMKRGQELQKAGSISKVDVAQLESQYSSDKYQLTVSENSLSTYKLQLKQLLELPLKRTYRDWETDRKSTRLNSSHRL